MSWRRHNGAAWNGDLAALTNEELRDYARHCMEIGVHPRSRIMDMVRAEMLRRMGEQPPKSPKVTVTVERKPN